MRLSKRVIASRANGALSRGPKTEEGKRRSSANALRHGLLSKCVVLQNESQETFAQLLAQHLVKLGPADDVEHGVIEEMASAAWRLRRLWAIETSLLDKGIEKRSEVDEVARIAAAFSDLAAGNELDLLDRYEGRLHRMYQRSLHNFLLLRGLDANMADPDVDANVDANVDADVLPSLFPALPAATSDENAKNNQTNLDSNNWLKNE